MNSITTTHPMSGPAVPGPQIGVAPEDEAGTEEFIGEGLDLRKVAALIRRHIIAVVIIVALAIAAGVAVTLLTIPHYIATSSILIEQQADQIIEDSDVTKSSAQPDVERFLQTQLDILGSRGLAERVVTAEKLSTDPKFFSAIQAGFPEAGSLNGGTGGLQEVRRREAVAGLSRNLRIALRRQSRVVSIGFESTDPVLSARVSNAVARNFIDSNLNRKYDSSTYARQFLLQQLQDTRAKLENSERELNRYSRDAGLIRVSGGASEGSGESALSVTNDSLVQANTMANQAAAERVAAQDRWENIAQAPVLSVPQVLANSAVQNLIQQRSTAEADLARERARHLDDHPSVLALRAQVAKLDTLINSVGNSIRQSVLLEYEVAKDREAKLKNNVTELRTSALGEQDRGVQYNILKRVAETNRALYDALLERYNKLNASAGSAANNVSLVDAAEVPAFPSSPSLPKNLAIALLLGLAMGGLYVFIRNQFDDTIRVPTDVEEKLGVNLLGLIPLAEGGLITAVEDRKSAVGEAYATLVTNLNYATAHGVPRTIVVTSAQEAEGKSTTAFSVATELARLGKNVLLIDADLRRPTLHRTIASEEPAGLSDLLTGQARFEDVIRNSPDYPLSFITAGPIPPDPSMLLGGAQITRMLADATARFDVTILDCPPMLGLSDAAALAAQSEGVLFVIDSSMGQRGAAKSALRRLRLVRSRILGAVLTKFNPKNAGAEYSYYGYSYYRYGNDEAAKS